MTNTHRILIASFTSAFSVTAAFGAKSADLKPVLAKPGSVSADESFSSATLAKDWTVAKGDWQVQDGALVGKEKKEDQHAAVLTLGKPNHNSIIRFSFKLDGSKGLALSYNSAKGGHLFRVQIAAEGVTILKDKDKKDPNSKTEPLGKAAAKFEQGQWYTMLVETQGGKVSVQTDNGVKLTGANPALDVGKTGYRFVTSGESIALDDVTTWEAQP
jgi:hypothetical protein